MALVFAGLAVANAVTEASLHAAVAVSTMNSAGVHEGAQEDEVSSPGNFAGAAT